MFKRSHEQIELMNQKLQVIGSLTRHDVSNILMAAKTNLYLLRKKLKDEPELLKYIDSTDDAINQSAKILKFKGCTKKLASKSLL
jgi:hypothetical protein